MLELTQLQFDGFRSYPSALNSAPANTLPLRPLTLVLGRNNTGKSQALRLAHMLVAALGSEDSFNLPTEIEGRTIAHNPREHFYFGSPAHPLRVLLDWTLEGTACQLSFSVGLPPPGDSTQLIGLEWKFKRGSAEQRGESLLPLGSLSDWDATRRALGGLSKRSVALTGERTRIQRAYPIPSGQRRSMGADGARCVEWLYHSPELLQRTRDWLEAVLPPTRLDINTSQGDLRLLDVSGPEPIHLADAAEGVQQLLPVVTLLQARILERGAALDTLEQPELHLHAAAHGELGDLLLKAAGILDADGSQPRPQRLLVETHSEGLLLRVRRRIAEGRVRAGDVGVVFVDRDKRGSRIQVIPLDDRGTPTWWPTGIFLEGLEEAKAISRAIRGAGEPPR